MADIPEINPLHPSWPIRPTDKSGDRKRRQQEQKKEKKPRESDKNNDGSGIDEYA